MASTAEQVQQQLAHQLHGPGIPLLGPALAEAQALHARQYQPIPQQIAQPAPETLEAHRIARGEGPEAAAAARHHAATHGHLGRMHQGRFHEMAPQYMNPYQHHVVNRLSELGGRTFREQVLPAINQSFAGKGLAGSRRNQELAARAARDMQESVLAAQQTALHQGYGQAAQHFGWDEARMLENSKVQEDMAKISHAIALSKMTALREAGASKEQLDQARLQIEHDELEKAREHPFQMLNYYMAMLHGAPYQASHMTTSRTTTQVPQSLHRGAYQRAGLGLGADVAGKALLKAFGLS